jgi:hypothetical protein
VKVNQNGNDLSIVYGVDQWTGSKLGMCGHFGFMLKFLVPQIFKRFKGINQITISAIALNDDGRTIMRANFSRRTSETIDWVNIYWPNLFKLADSYWQDAAMPKLSIGSGGQLEILD